jgi:hypothetical protein
MMDNPASYRSRAAQLRAMANASNDTTGSEALRRLAEGYEAVARANEVRSLSMSLLEISAFDVSVGERNVSRYRARAEELRVVAETLDDPTTSDALTQVADGYDEMADRLSGTAEVTNLHVT